VFWEAYWDVLDRTIKPPVEATSRTQLHSLWLESPGGEEWMWAVEEEWLDDVEAGGSRRVDLPHCLEDVVEHLHEHEMWAAAD